MSLACEGMSIEELHKLGLKPADAVILRWCMSSRSGYTKYINNEFYFWIDYAQVNYDLPFMQFNSRQDVHKFFRHLCGIGEPNETSYPLKRIILKENRSGALYAFRKNVLARFLFDGEDGSENETL